MTKRQLLALRGSAASAVATLVAALSHSWAGGDLPAPLLVGGMAALLVFPGMALMGARPKLRRIALTVPALQLMFHLAFTALGSPVEGASVVGGHHHADAWQPLTGHASAVTVDAGMLAAHIAAAVVTVAILAYGERAILTLLGWASGWIRSRAVAPAIAAPFAPAPIAGVVRTLRSRLGALAAAPRGPPLFV
ncbi:hypothetical protein [Microbacterium halophytorum]|uniref:hypothetical protein n=1 Tax=Microbacterium halophytorum TaxID=2067568 RepID=UPI000CFB077B|nr:hypothetical protein [Microbacterium halophytorum]